MERAVHPEVHSRALAWTSSVVTHSIWIFCDGPPHTNGATPALRQVTVWDAEHERELVFLTNIFHLAASTIGAIYKDRWQIELFFKALKQNLKIKTFVGTSENAVNVQIWTALIAMLLLKFLLLKSTWSWSLSNLAAMLRFNLLSYRDLWAWLDEPFKIPIVVPHEQQLALIE